MKRFLSLLKWDFTLFFKYGIYYAGIVVSIVWVLLFIYIPVEAVSLLLPAILFGDITIMGFFFIAAIILFEKREGTLKALSVTPVRHREYLVSKLTALTLFAVLVALIIAVMVQVVTGAAIQYPVLTAALLLNAVFFTLMGVVAVSPFTDISDFLVPSFGYILFFSIPALDYFGLTANHWTHWVFYLHPTQPALLLFKAATRPLQVWEYIYSIVYLVLLIVLVYRWALSKYRTAILENSGEEA